tara:strand:- start:1890 stop:2399 length:510 start_codon:yes stop_codon:yes gene_type:complete
MYSGKSTELMRRVNRYKCIGKRVLVVNHALDTRYSKDPVMVTHSGEQMDAIKVDDLKWVVPINYDVIAIDEGQLFKRLYNRVMHFVEQMNLNVIVAGLNGDYKRQNFGEIYKLYPVASNIHHCLALCSQCKDGTPGMFTCRITDETDQLLIGSEDMYIAVCRRCFTKTN